MENDDVADSLSVTEVYSLSGHWSSYLPHRHDVDNFPELTYLEEVYYHWVNPGRGYGRTYSQMAISESSGPQLDLRTR